MSDRSDHSDVVRDLAGRFPFNRADIADIFKFTRRVAWALRGESCGLLEKPGGENIHSYQGTSYSISRVCYPDGQIYKILSDAGPGGANGPQWVDDGTVEAHRYRAALPPDPEPAPPVEPPPAPAAAGITSDQAEHLIQLLHESTQAVDHLAMELERANNNAEKLQRDGVRFRFS